MKGELIPKDTSKDLKPAPWRQPYPKPFDSTKIPEPVILPPQEMRKGLRRIIWHVIKALMIIFFRMKAVGAENIPSGEPTILLSEHRSLLDIPLIHLSNRSWIHWLGKVELFKSRFGFHFFPWWGTIAVDRKSMSSKTVREVYRVLGEQKVLGIFPQGSRCKTLEQVKTTEPKPGVARFALKFNVTIIPVAIEGDYKLFRRTRAIYGPPLKIVLPEGKTRITPPEERALVMQMMQAIYALKGETYAFEYPDDVEVSDQQFLFPIA